MRCFCLARLFRNEEALGKLREGSEAVCACQVDVKGNLTKASFGIIGPFSEMRFLGALYESAHTVTKNCVFWR